MLYVALFVVVVVVVVVALGLYVSHLQNVAIEMRRASAEHKYLTSNTYSKWSK